MSHRALNYRQFGNPMQYDTQVVEKSHIYYAKRTAKRTSRHASTLDIQSSMRNWENLVIDRAMLDETCQCSFIKKPKEQTREDDLALLDDSTTEFLDTNTEGDLGEIESDRTPSQILYTSKTKYDEKTGKWVYDCYLRFSGNNKRRKVSDEVHWHDNNLKEEIL